MCLSGCLTAYRRNVLVELEPILENRNVLGVPIKYGEDRFLTRQIVKAGYETTITLDAICWTVAPEHADASTSRSSSAGAARTSSTSSAASATPGASTRWSRSTTCPSSRCSSATRSSSSQNLVVRDLLGPGRSSTLQRPGALRVHVLARTRGSCPPPQRVHPIWFLPMAVVMPVTYLLYTPLALFTLDSSSWETRGTPQASARGAADLACPTPSLAGRAQSAPGGTT